MRTPITFVELATAGVPDEPLLKDKSWILSGVSSYFDLRGYFFLEPHLRKDASLGVLFENVTPTDAGTFELELGTLLPDLFPNLEGKPEYALGVTIEGSTRDVCFSNVMSRLRFTKNDHLLHALIPRRALTKVREGEVAFIPADASVELLRTFAACRYTLQGGNAEEALENHCEQCIHDFIERLNRILQTMPFVDATPGHVYSVAYSRASFPYFYFILKGASEDDLGHGWISPHVGRTLLNPPSLPSLHTDELRQYLDGTRLLDDIDALLHAAQTFWDGGVLEYTLLLSVIAAEVATQRHVYERLIATSVSKTKVADALKGDLTYSLMLNVVLVSLAPDDRKPDTELLGKINRGRSLRNAYMHEGRIPHDAKEINDILVATRAFVEYVRQIHTVSGDEALESQRQLQKDAQTSGRMAVAAFLQKQTGAIRRSILGYTVPKDAVKQLFRGLEETYGTSKAAEDTYTALRFLSYYLADRANHAQAKVSAYLNNVYRSKHRFAMAHDCMRAKEYRVGARKWLMAFVIWVFGTATGYMERPLRLLAVAIAISGIFAVAFLALTVLTPDDYTSIRFTTGGDSPPQLAWYHHFYFSTVTLTTLGYGDLAPTHSNVYRSEERIVLLLCSLEAITGYVLLGLAVAVLTRRLDAHPTARREELLREYAERHGLSE